MVKNVKIFVSHVNAHQGVTSAEECFNSKIERTTHSVIDCDASQPLFPKPPVIVQWTHEESGHSGKNRGCSRALPHEYPLTNANLTIATTEYPICQPQRTTLGPNTAPLSRVISQPPGGGLITLNLFHHRRGNVLFLLE